MASPRSFLAFPSRPLVFFFFFFFFFYYCCCFLTAVSTAAVTGNVGASASDRKIYIVYMGALPKGKSTEQIIVAHEDMVDRVCGSGASSANIVHHYKRSFDGFSAMLSDEEANVIKGMDGVVSVYPGGIMKLHTTRSWDFMHFPLTAPRVPGVESDIIVGVIDTGIWPKSESFNDTGYGPPPAKWKGICQIGPHFKCNNKIIGGRFYNSTPVGEGEILSPVDWLGHGTHTASTAAGRQVAGVDLYGFARGTARGGVPSARIAVYKVCWKNGCHKENIKLAMDDAIADGVDIISVSIGFEPVNYFLDPIAVASFHAMKKGILTSVSAGNAGPSYGTVQNSAPWMLTVAASTIDRRFVADAKLGNGKIYEGVAINTFHPEGKMYPLIYGGDAPPYNPYQPRQYYCINSSLVDEKLVKGKIVLCHSGGGSDEVSLMGGVGAIMQASSIDTAFSYPLPALLLDVNDGKHVRSYINTTSNPSATISRSKQIKDPKAPYVASFSSRGPNRISDILKPDVTAPGVDIIAAWSNFGTMSGLEPDKRRVKYNIISGTSMACPHVSGSAAYIKSFHPTWSPAAIKSALMTTALPMRSSSSYGAELAYGAGHINPLKALHPGLIYDAGEEDYVKMLCGAGYDTTKLRKVTDDNSACSTSNKGGIWDLNYPSFALVIRDGTVSRRFLRKVTNVGPSNSTYKVTVDTPPELRVHVHPRILSFKHRGEKQSFIVSITAVKKITKETIISASLTWRDGVHTVRSPIVAYSSE